MYRPSYPHGRAAQARWPGNDREGNSLPNRIARWTRRIIERATRAWRAPLRAAHGGVLPLANLRNAPLITIIAPALPQWLQRFSTNHLRSILQATHPTARPHPHTRPLIAPMDHSGTSVAAADRGAFLAKRPPVRGPAATGTLRAWGPARAPVAGSRRRGVLSRG